MLDALKQDEFGEDGFRAAIGAEAIKHILHGIDIDAEKVQAACGSEVTPPARPSARSSSSA